MTLLDIFGNTKVIKFIVHITLNNFKEGEIEKLFDKMPKNLIKANKFDFEIENTVSVDMDWSKFTL